VRVGRGLQLTPRAEALAPLVRAALEQLLRVYQREDPFDPASARATFRLRTTDHVGAVLLAPALPSLLAAAPGLELRVQPIDGDDAPSLRQGEADLALGVFRKLRDDHRVLRLFEDRFVTVARLGHPALERGLELETFLRLPHALVSPRGGERGQIDEALAQRGLSRQIAVTAPHLLLAAEWVSRSDLLLTVSWRLAHALSERLGLRLYPPPLPLPPYALVMAWHPRMDRDPAHTWLRERLAAVARALPALPP
jgi:DNA-binding transcriptional LysR family regulator